MSLIDDLGFQLRAKDQLIAEIAARVEVYQDAAELGPLDPQQQANLITDQNSEIKALTERIVLSDHLRAALGASATAQAVAPADNLASDATLGGGAINGMLPVPVLDQYGNETGAVTYSSNYVAAALPNASGAAPGQWFRPQGTSGEIAAPALMLPDGQAFYFPNGSSAVQTNPAQTFHPFPAGAPALIGYPANGYWL